MNQTYVYWISTSLLSLLYLSSAAMYIFKGDWVRKALADLGYPVYLVRVLIAAKLLAVATLISRFNVALGDLAYAGMLFHLLLSAAAHLGVRKPAQASPALAGLVLLAASFMTQNMGRDTASPYAPTVAAAVQRPLL